MSKEEQAKSLMGSTVTITRGSFKGDKGVVSGVTGTQLHCAMIGAGFELTLTFDLEEVEFEMERSRK